jgi:hypothetical protein
VTPPHNSIGSNTLLLANFLVARMQQLIKRLAAQYHVFKKKFLQQRSFSFQSFEHLHYYPRFCFKIRRKQWDLKKHAPVIRTYFTTSKKMSEEHYPSASTTISQTPNHLQNFVSNHYSLPKDTVVSYLTRKKITFKEALSNPDKILVQYCPFCHDIKGKQSNMWKLYIDKKNGRFNCFRCGAKGSW